MSTIHVDEELELHPDMKPKCDDSAIFFMLKDAARVNMDEFFPVGQNVFRPMEVRPKIDRIITDDSLLVRLLLEQ